jgi:(E)-4-hydroxy-3-methylbut-2-enyl-diphosphate synthase
MADAHYGYVGCGDKKVNLYRSKDLVYQNIEEDLALEKLIEMIKQDGNWKEKLDIIK